MNSCTFTFYIFSFRVISRAFSVPTTNLILVHRARTRNILEIIAKLLFL